MLREKYDDLGLITQKHIRVLFEISMISKENDLLLRRLLDSVLKLRALKTLKRSTDHWDDPIVHLITSRLDQKTNKAWEVTVKRGEIPTLKQLTEFLAQHCKTLETSARTTRADSSPGSNQERSNQAKSSAANVATTSNKCVYCDKEGHAIYKCNDYLHNLLEINERVKEARARKLCLNCLRGQSRTQLSSVILEHVVNAVRDTTHYFI